MHLDERGRVVYRLLLVYHAHRKVNELFNPGQSLAETRALSVQSVPSVDARSIGNIRTFGRTPAASNTINAAEEQPDGS